MFLLDVAHVGAPLLVHTADHELHPTLFVSTAKGTRRATLFGIDEDQQELVQGTPGIPVRKEQVRFNKPPLPRADDDGDEAVDDGQHEYDTKVIRMQRSLNKRTVKLSRASMKAMEKIFESDKAEYQKAMDTFDKDYNAYAGHHESLQNIYAQMKKAYVDKCLPLEDKYDINPSCSKLFHRAVDEYLARRNWPDVKIGTALTIDLLPSETKTSCLCLGAAIACGISRRPRSEKRDHFL
eukprot:GEMP01040062.1.p1 GENE.GEMP01040062.1~~GEMP01040062.1.p1  ORF type:complete len:238 (+),score=51.48 GEMP01040062.1:165-878(+)